MSPNLFPLWVLYIGYALWHNHTFFSRGKHFPTAINGFALGSLSMIGILGVGFFINITNAAQVVGLVTATIMLVAFALPEKDTRNAQ